MLSPVVGVMPMFPQPYVPSALCSLRAEGPMFPILGWENMREHRVYFGMGEHRAEGS